MMKLNNRVKTTEIKLQTTSKQKKSVSNTQTIVPTTSSQKFASIFTKSPIEEGQKSEHNLQFIAVLSGSESHLKKFKGEGYDRVLMPSQPVN